MSCLIMMLYTRKTKKKKKNVQQICLPNYLKYFSTLKIKFEEIYLLRHHGCYQHISDDIASQQFEHK